MLKSKFHYQLALCYILRLLRPFSTLHRLDLNITSPDFTPTMNRQTITYANHQIPLECDVYSSPAYPSNTPAFLFFHSGGLVGGARNCVPPWLVQVCLQRQWPLISASYRLLPQANGACLLEDVEAAYEFARKWGQGEERPVIVGGSSAGFFCAAMVAHHLQPQPIALLSITGIPTFRHPFFNSSTLISPEPFTKAQMQKYLDEPVSVGSEHVADSIFYPDSLTETGAKKAGYERPSPTARPSDGNDGLSRGCLYDYFVHENTFVPMLDSYDPGYEWATTHPEGSKFAQWPTTILIQGDSDPDVDADVAIQTAKNLGPKKARLFIAKGQSHLFEAASFLEDKGLGMDAVRLAIKELDNTLSQVYH
ncbi:alpha/beta-hydrolase [Xylaria acuta]|nr:alpha/beta-hydrolase [Xylaria acuta]